MCACSTALQNQRWPLVNDGFPQSKRDTLISTHPTPSELNWLWKKSVCTKWQTKPTNHGKGMVNAQETDDAFERKWNRRYSQLCREMHGNCVVVWQQLPSTTSCSEQIFSWLSKYAKMTRSMSEHTFMFFIMYICLCRLLTKLTNSNLL